jgi:isocitrate dehydrogenase kinase/phosphatase
MRRFALFWKRRIPSPGRTSVLRIDAAFAPCAATSPPIVFTLASHDLVFKVIRGRFGQPKKATRNDAESWFFVDSNDIFPE